MLSRGSPYLQRARDTSLDYALTYTEAKSGSLPSCENHDVRFELRSIREFESLLGETLNSASVLDLDVAIDDVGARTGIYQNMLTWDAVSCTIFQRLANVVSSCMRVEKLDDACIVRSEISLETCFGETIKNLSVLASRVC